MAFDTFAFIMFFAATTAIYFCLVAKWQNRFLLFSSYVFYGYLNPWFCTLLFASTLLDYVCANKIQAHKNAGDQANLARNYLVLSLISNFGVLIGFKALGVSSEISSAIYSLLGLSGSSLALEIAVPVGLSFYTFQTAGYVIDVYRQEVEAEGDFFDFALFVSLYPQLISGPIEKAKKLLPQIRRSRRVSFSDVNHATWLIVLGLFKKVAVADNLYFYVKDFVFNFYSYNSTAALLGIYICIIYAYADFSGYCHIARGVGKLLGFELSINFRSPLLSKNPADFWRRWHITLVVWSKKNIFLPLYKTLSPTLGRRTSFTLAAATSLTTFGLWHGFKPNFLAFGIYHAVLLIGYFAINPASINVFRHLAYVAGVWRTASHFVFFHLLAYSSVFFFVEQKHLWTAIIKRVFTMDFGPASNADAFVFFGFPIIVLEVLFPNGADDFLGYPKIARLAIASCCLLFILLCGASQRQEFIYFQF